MEHEAVAYDLPIPSAREALIIDGNIQFNSVSATADDIEGAIGDSILLCRDVLANKTKVIGMKGE